MFLFFDDHPRFKDYFRTITPCTITNERQWAAEHLVVGYNNGRNKQQRSLSLCVPLFLCVLIIRLVTTVLVTGNLYSPANDHATRGWFSPCGTSRWLRDASNRNAELNRETDNAHSIAYSSFLMHTRESFSLWATSGLQMKAFRVLFWFAVRMDEGRWNLYGMG